MLASNRSLPPVVDPPRWIEDPPKADETLRGRMEGVTESMKHCNGDGH